MHWHLHCRLIKTVTTGYMDLGRGRAGSPPPPPSPLGDGLTLSQSLTVLLICDKGTVLYQSLFTNTLVEHAYTEIHKLKNKHGVKKNLQ